MKTIHFDIEENQGLIDCTKEAPQDLNAGSGQRSLNPQSQKKVFLFLYETQAYTNGLDIGTVTLFKMLK